MKLSVRPSRVSGELLVPGSKSHTIRGLVIGTLAQGESILRNPLDSKDVRACVRGCRALGARVSAQGEAWVVEGCPGRPSAARNVVHLGNSGTSLRILTSVACLPKEATVFTGDASLRTRPVGPLLDCLRSLGAKPFSALNDGKLPIVCRGPLRGGEADVDGTTSQYLTSLLISCPLGTRESLLRVNKLNERPYVDMTLSWLDRCGVSVAVLGKNAYRVPGEQSYRPFDARIPGDFSSAAFPLCAAAVAGGELLLKGLDMDDLQGDRAVIDELRRMGLAVSFGDEGVLVKGSPLQGRSLDLNSIPDALPVLSVVGCLCQGATRLHNVPQARIKECDRIEAMATELKKMGASIQEEEEGLLIRASKLHGASVHSRGDHRVAMALAVAGLVAEGTTVIQDAECIGVTFPGFVEKMKAVGAQMSLG